MLTNKKALVISTVIYIVIAIVFTWPLAGNLTTHGFGVDEDAPYHIWHNWWLKFSLFDLKQNPLWTDYIFHPQKIPLIYDANSFVFAALTLPLQSLYSVLTASNLIFISSFVLSGLSMFLLAKYLVNRPEISFFAGLVFAFSPYTFAQAIDGHTNLTTTWIIPLYTYFLLCALSKAVENNFSTVPNASAGIPTHPWNTFRLSIVTGLLAALQLYSDFTYTTFLIIETGLIVLFFFAKEIFSNDNTKLRQPFVTMIRIIVTGLFVAGTAAAVSSPLLFEIAEASKIGLRPSSPLWVQNEWSADLTAFFRPPDRSTFLKPWSYTPIRGTVEGTVFIGLVTAVLFLFAALKRMLKKINPSIDLWLFLSFAFFLLSLGPSLHINGQLKFDLFGFKELVLPLPWLLLHKIPLIGEAQEPTRINPFLMMSLASVTAILIKEFQTSLNSKFRLGLTALLSALVVIEFAPIPFPITDLKAPEIFQKIAQDKSNFSVLVLPLGFNSGNLSLGKSPIGSLQYFQVIHQHPSFRATVARLPYENFAYYQNLPLIPYLIEPSGPLEINPSEYLKIRKLFKETLHIKYIVVFEDKYTNTLGETYRVLKEVLNAERFYDVNTIKGYILN